MKRCAFDGPAVTCASWLRSVFFSENLNLAHCRSVSAVARTLRSALKRRECKWRRGNALALAREPSPTVTLLRTASAACV